MFQKSQQKTLLLGVILLVIILALAGCGGQETSPATEPEAPGVVDAPAETEKTAEQDLPVFTLEELAAFNGKDGRPAYVAVDGLVYDFSELGGWSGGTHNGFGAGQDLTEALLKVSPHGDRVLSRAPVVGTLE